MIAGLWHAHVGWMFKADPPNLYQFVRDLKSDRLMINISRLFGFWVLLGLLVPAIVGGVVSGTWTGALLGFLWGGLARVLLHHVTWSINSACHLWGQRPFKSRDHSTNNLVFGVLAFGEGWHNNHHAFPTSARHGLAWWELDLSYLVIRVLNLIGLAWHVRVPAAATIASRRVPRTARNA